MDRDEEKNMNIVNGNCDCIGAGTACLAQRALIREAKLEGESVFCGAVQRCFLCPMLQTNQ